MEMAEAQDFLIGFDALFRSMTPDSAIVFMLFVVLLKKLVEKELLTQEEVFGMSIRAGELITEISEYFKE